jgi:Transposase (partial DDE domain)/HTH domain in Mos1 transposase
MLTSKGYWHCISLEFATVILVMETYHDKRAVLLHSFRLGRTSKEAHADLVLTDGEDAPSLATCHRWYTRFKKGDYNLDDQPRSGRPISRKPTRVLTALKKDPKKSVRMLAAETSTPKTTVCRTLHRAGKTAKLPQVIPHDLSQAQLKKRVEVCRELLSRRSNLRWVNSIIAADEKWITYDNPERRLQWCDVDEKPQPTPKKEQHEKREMLCFFFCSLGPLYWEILAPNTSVTADLFTQQLEEVAIRVPPELMSEGKILMLMDNAPPPPITRKSPKPNWTSLIWNGFPIHHIPLTLALATTIVSAHCLTSAGEGSSRTETHSFGHSPNGSSLSLPSFGREVLTPCPKDGDRSRVRRGHTLIIDYCKLLKK